MIRFRLRLSIWQTLQFRIRNIQVSAAIHDISWLTHLSGVVDLTLFLTVHGLFKIIEIVVVFVLYMWSNE